MAEPSPCGSTAASPSPRARDILGLTKRGLCVHARRGRYDVGPLSLSSMAGDSRPSPSYGGGQEAGASQEECVTDAAAGGELVLLGRGGGHTAGRGRADELGSG
jgi:hypothetical protein